IRLDPSTDKSESVIRHYIEKHENVHLICPSEPSGSAGQNFFNLILEVEFEKYDYIAFADQDDIWLSNKLARADMCLTENGVSAYSGNVIAWWETGKKKIVFKSSPQVKYDYLFESAGPGCTFVFQIEFACALKRYLQFLGEEVKSLWLHDWFCYAFACSRGFKWFIDDKPMMMYRQHEINAIGANSGLLALRRRVKEVLSGNAFDKVKCQASILGLNDQAPIDLLIQDKFISSIKLAFHAHECRRKPTDKLFFAMAMIIHAFGRL
ncbi:glycosyltransferase family 2 protein, partial [Salinivibrio sp. VYel4]|uniref:glycosyltransferase family 2 protein n=1 Tax=Salinivibrio sp. VYel4 TaxID=2490491 RepID=UPI001562CD12